MANKVSFVINLQNRFSRVAKKVSASTSLMTTKVNKLSISLARMQRRSGEASKKLARMGAVATAVATVPIALLARSMINAASDAVETSSKFNQVFDDVASKANQVANEFAKSFGVAGSTAKELIGNTGDLLVGLGFTGDAALDLSKQISELGADLASFQNFQGGAKGASEALTKALIGETESAKSLGIVIRQGTPEFKKNILQVQRAQQVTEMQAKAIVILRMAQEQSRKAIGDVNRTWADYANVTRRADERTKELREVFGKLLLPAATKIAITVTKLIEKLNGLSKPMKTLILIIAGLIAVAGPLLILLAGIAFAFSVISLPILAIVAAIALAVGAFLWLKMNWLEVSNAIGGTIEQIGINFSLLWEDVMDGFKAVVAFFRKGADFILDTFTSVKDTILNLPGISLLLGDTAANSQTPTTPVTQSSRADVDITLRAPEGVVESTKTKRRGSGSGLNLGLNMAPAQ